MAVVELQIALRDDFQCIENLMQFYTYDFSEWLPLKIGGHGFFSIEPKAGYLKSPSTSPFLIKVDGEIAGFVTVDDEVHFEDATFNIGYFFVSRRYRGRGIAQHVVSLLLERFVGGWQIFYITENKPARLFWSKIIPELTQGIFTEHPIKVDGYDCTLLKFNNSSSTFND